MTGLMWIGFVPGASDAPDLEHQRFDVPGGTVLALSVDPEMAETEQGIVTWAALQNNVLSAYATAGDVVPLPLGSVFSAKHALLAQAVQQAPVLQSAGEKLAGKVEYALHVRAAPTCVPSPTDVQSGRAYLVQRSRQRRCRTEVGRERTGALAALAAVMTNAATDVCPLSRTGPDRVLDLAALVPRSGISEMIKALHVAANKADDVGLSCRLVGPGPAYSFAFPAGLHG